MAFARRVRAPTRSNTRDNTVLNFGNLLHLDRSDIGDLFIESNRVNGGLTIRVSVNNFRTFRGTKVNRATITSNDKGANSPGATRLSLPALTITMFVLPDLMGDVLNMTRRFTTRATRALNARRGTLAALTENQSVDNA